MKMLRDSYYPGTYTTADDPRISKGYRVRVVQDEDAEDPRGWGDHITTNSDEYKRWAAGEVYGVIVERVETCIPLEDVLLYVYPEDSPNKFTRWIQVESLWSCYLDPDYTGITVAHEIAPDAVTEG